MLFSSLPIQQEFEFNRLLFYFLYSVKLPNIEHIKLSYTIMIPLLSAIFSVSSFNIHPESIHMARVDQMIQPQ